MKIPCPDGCGLEVETLDYHEVEKLKKSHAALLEALREEGHRRCGEAMTTSTKDYLGDGVYAEMDGYLIKLTTERDFGATTHVIYLEPEVYAALVDYARRMWNLDEPEVTL